jgi:hypothetical protein
MPLQVDIKVTGKIPHDRDYCITRDNQDSDMSIFLADRPLGLAYIASIAGRWSRVRFAAQIEGVPGRVYSLSPVPRVSTTQEAEREGARG